MANYIDKIIKDGVEYEIHAANGGTKLYLHTLKVTNIPKYIYVYVLSNLSTPVTAFTDFNDKLMAIVGSSSASRIVWFDSVNKKLCYLQCNGTVIIDDASVVTGAIGEYANIYDDTVTPL